MLRDRIGNLTEWKMCNCHPTQWVYRRKGIINQLTVRFR